MKDPDSFKVKMAVLCVVVVAGIIFYPAHQRDELQEQYDELYDKYTDLEAYYDDTHYRYEEMDSKYDSYVEAISKCEDPLVVLSCYFDADEWRDDEKATFEEAYNAYEELCSIIYPFY